MDPGFWSGKKVLITGHTGFKGSWLCLWLISQGAKVTGYALPPPTTPSLFEICRIDSRINSIIADIRDKDTLRSAFVAADPDIVIHMAAQPLVRESYTSPAITYETNVMGTVFLLDAVREAILHGQSVKAVVNVTTDKCYENREWIWGYRENDILGGYDPYSNSKACSELVTASYRNSFFNPKEYEKHGVAIATARAGNVIGGGDWAADRLIPDCIRSLLDGVTITIRSPGSIRPWQHVLEPLSGYLVLAQKLYEYGPDYAEAWNFGPDHRDAKPVSWVVQEICRKWGNGASFQIDAAGHPHEAGTLKLDCSKAHFRLGWQPSWSLEHTLDKVIEWSRAYQNNEDMSSVCFRQLREYVSSAAKGR